MAGNRPRSLGLAQSGSVWLSLARSGSVWLVHARADSFFCILSWNNLEGELRDQQGRIGIIGRAGNQSFGDVIPRLYNAG